MLFEPIRVVTSAKTPGRFSTGIATSTFALPFSTRMPPRAS